MVGPERRPASDWCPAGTTVGDTMHDIEITYCVS